MISLFLVLGSIALLDSVSMIPLCVIPLTAILGGRRPLRGAAAFLAGVLVVYAGGGVVLLLGVDAIFTVVGGYFERLWKEPQTPELILQIVIGGVLVAFGWRLARARQMDRTDAPAGEITPGRSFSLAVGLTVVGMPGALPYFGAIDQILRAEPGPVLSASALMFYNIVFISPLVLLVAIRILAPERSEAIFAAVAGIAERWGRRVIVLLLMVVGLLLVADGIGWFAGRPLLPVELVSQSG